MAYQILENNMGVKDLVLVGVCGQGFELAEKFTEELKIIKASFRVNLIEIKLDKENPRDTIVLNEELNSLAGKSILLVDDVLNTGRILAYSLQALLAIDTLKIETAVLVDRGHPQFPITATYSGYQLSTTLEEHIEVNLGKKPAVYLY